MGRYSDSGIGVGIAPGAQTALEQSVYTNAVKAAEANIEREILIGELNAKGVKFSEEDIAFIVRDQTGQVTWLEKGSSYVGLQHIEERHAGDFKKKFGIERSDIPSFIESIVRNGAIISDIRQERAGRLTVQRVYEYGGEHFVLIASGSNGFIVSAYPVKKPKGL